MSQPDTLLEHLCRLAAVSEELLRRLQQRDPLYIESLELRHRLLADLLRLPQPARLPPTARAVLERIGQLGDLCQQQALALQQETSAALAALDQQTAYASSLSRIAARPASGILDIRA